MAAVTDLRVVIADDHPIWRSGLRADLSVGFEVVGEAEDAPSAIAVINAARPDVVLCDIHMPGGGGLAVVVACGANVPIVMLTVSEVEADVLDAVAAGAFGYLTKSTSPEALQASLRRVANGEPVFSPALAALVLGEFRRVAGRRSEGNPLSAREREVLRLVGRGLSYRAVAETLFISPKTVENHVRNILGKLQLSRKAELIRYAADHKMD